jgi:hypothetical protein
MIHLYSKILFRSFYTTKQGETMQGISFGSTYRIPLTQPGMGTAKKDLLKKIASQYQNVLYPSGNSGNVRVSIRKRLDNRFEQEIRQVGIKTYQKFDRHNVPKTNFENSGVPKLDLYIKDELAHGNYRQFGKQKK